MKSIAIIALLATLSAAVPLRQRDYAYETVTADIVQTTSVTTTIWVDATDGAQAAALTSSAPSVPPASTSVTSSTTTAAQEQFQLPSAASSAPAYSAPAPSSQAPAPSPSTSAYSTPSSTYQAPATTPTSTYVPSYMTPTSTWSPSSSAYSTSSAPATTSSTSSSGSSGSGACPAGSPCVGEITYFQAGTGACGNTVDGTTDSIIAMPFEMMGSQSNGNPFCGMGVKISYGGKTIDAVVQDKCPSCTGNHIDLSEAAFTQLLPEASGTATASWWFAEPTSS